MTHVVYSLLLHGRQNSMIRMLSLFSCIFLIFLKRPQEYTNGTSLFEFSSCAQTNKFDYSMYIKVVL